MWSSAEVCISVATYSTRSNSPHTGRFCPTGVVSGLGKGVTASSIGVLLKASGYRVSCIKIGVCRLPQPCCTSTAACLVSNTDAPCLVLWSRPPPSRVWLVLCSDPYINMDAGTMSPFEHGEVFVLDDGGEVSVHKQCPGRGV